MLKSTTAACISLINIPIVGVLTYDKDIILVHSTHWRAVVLNCVCWLLYGHDPSSLKRDLK